MTDNRIEKIRAEIERLKHQSVIDSDRQAERGLQSASMASFGKVKACEELLSFIDSIQKEPKECMYSKDNYTDEDRKILCDGCEEECEFNKREEPVNEDLNKAAEECAEVTYSETNSVLTWRILEDIVIKAFKAGAKWMNNIICSEIEKRLQYMQYAPHRVDTYKELKSLLAYIKSYV